jgi:hypothetical protein
MSSALNRPDAAADMTSANMARASGDPPGGVNFPGDWSG